jgi:hypothetical protein
MAARHPMVKPEEGRQSFALQIQYRGGEITYVRSRPRSNAVGCIDHLKIAVTAFIRTGGGARDKRLDAHLIASTPYFATLVHRLDAGALNGTFAITQITPSGGRTGAISEGGGASGQLELKGLKPDPCTMQPVTQHPNGGTQGCRGTVRTLIERGTW